MAMTFTIVSHLREQLSTLIRARSERRKKEALELERKVLEVGPRLWSFSLIHPIYDYRKRKLALGAPQLRYSRSRSGRLYSIEQYIYARCVVTKRNLRP